MKFEYATLDLDAWDGGRSGVDQLKSLGVEGWELVSVAKSTAYLKRGVSGAGPSALAKVCSNCRCFREHAEKDASGQAFGQCADWKVAVSGGGSCERFAPAENPRPVDPAVERAYGQAEGQASPYQDVGGRPTSQSAGLIPAAPAERGSAGGGQPDAESAWHWQPRTDFGERRLEATTSQASGVKSMDHKHKVVAILGKDGKVVRGKTDQVDGHEHAVAINGMCEEADGHTHTFDPVPRG